MAFHGIVRPLVAVYPYHMLTMIVTFFFFPPEYTLLVCR